MTVELITDDSFESRVVTAPQLVVVDFFTTWCGPCKVLSPTLDDLSEEYGDEVRFVKIDAEASPNATERYGVTGYPTVVMIRNGEEVDRFSGSWPRREVRSRIDTVLGKTAPALPGGDSTESIDLPSAVGRLHEALKDLSDQEWKQIHVALDEDAAAAAAAHHVSVDEALPELISRVTSDLDEYVAGRFGSDAAQRVIAASVPAYVDWLGSAGYPLNCGQLIASAPVRARLQVAPPSDLADSPSVFVGAVTGLSDLQWVELLRQAAMASLAAEPVHDLGARDRDQMVETYRAWFAAATVSKAVALSDCLDPELLEQAWAPFVGCLDRDAIENS